MKSELTREDILRIIEEEKQKIKTAAAKPKKFDELPDDEELVSHGLKVVNDDGVEYVIGSKTGDEDYVLKDPEGKKQRLAYKKLKSDFRVS
tara:strand:+ start:481 stop:753 length:273 start_codon:yes stop_codon:yes gene_type:complete